MAAAASASASGSSRRRARNTSASVAAITSSAAPSSSEDGPAHLVGQPLDHHGHPGDDVARAVLGLQARVAADLADQVDRAPALGVARAPGAAAPGSGPRPGSGTGRRSATWAGPTAGLLDRTPAMDTKSGLERSGRPVIPYAAPAAARPVWNRPWTSWRARAARRLCSLLGVPPAGREPARGGGRLLRVGLRLAAAPGELLADLVHGRVDERAGPEHDPGRRAAPRAPGTPGGRVRSPSSGTLPDRQPSSRISRSQVGS